jgi:hypothetical protein
MQTEAIAFTASDRRSSNSEAFEKLGVDLSGVNQAGDVQPPGRVTEWRLRVAAADVVAGGRQSSRGVHSVLIAAGCIGVFR